MDQELFNLNMQVLVNLAERAKIGTGNDILLLRKWMELLIISIDCEYGVPKDSSIIHEFSMGKDDTPAPMELTKHLCRCYSYLK